MRLKLAASGAKFFVSANGLHGSDALDGIHQIVRARREGRVDFVVGESAPLAQDVSRALEQEFEHLLLRLHGDASILGACSLSDFAAAEIAAESESGRFFSRMIFTIPSAARRKAKGSLEPVGIAPTAKHATSESSLSASATAHPVRFRGSGSSSPSGLY